MPKLTTAGSLEGITMRASVAEATWRPPDDIGERTTIASVLTSTVWYLTKGTIVALAIHGLVRMNVGGTSRPIVRGHLRLGKRASVTRMGIGTDTGIEIGTKGETGNETGNGIANKTVTTVVVWIMSDAVVDIAHRVSLCLSKPHPASMLTSLESSPSNHGLASL